MAFYNADDKTPSPENLPEAFEEFMIVQETGWTLEYIRSLRESDHKRISAMSHISQMVKNNRESFKIKLASTRPIF